MLSDSRLKHLEQLSNLAGVTVNENLNQPLSTFVASFNARNMFQYACILLWKLPENTIVLVVQWYSLVPLKKFSMGSPDIKSPTC